MTKTLHCYDYINHPFAEVRDALLATPHHVFRMATAAATTHAAALHARIAGLDVGTDVAIHIAEIARDTIAYDKPATRLMLEWSAARNPERFPTMLATLTVFPLTSTETQLELEGTYFAPLGKLGAAFDAVLGHRIAEQSVSRFVGEVAGWLREQLVAPAPPPKLEAARVNPDVEC